MLTLSSSSSHSKDDKQRQADESLHSKCSLYDGQRMTGPQIWSGQAHTLLSSGLQRLQRVCLCRPCVQTQTMLVLLSTFHLKCIQPKNLNVSQCSAHVDLKLHIHKRSFGIFKPTQTLKYQPSPEVQGVTQNGFDFLFDYFSASNLLSDLTKFQKKIQKLGVGII